MFAKVLVVVAGMALTGDGNGGNGGGAKAATQKCEDQCDMMIDMCNKGCEKSQKPQAHQMCKTQCDNLTKTCKDSCKERGAFDSEYAKEHVKMPKKPANMPDDGSGSANSGSDDFSNK